MQKTDISVSELVKKIQRRELVLPEMQRRYVWTATRVRDLLDSLYRGYPSGAILVWETDDDIITRNVSVESDETPATTRKLLLLDGQQRLTSLAAIISGSPVKVRNRIRPIEIMFNLEHPDGPPTEVSEVDENDSNVEENEGEGGASDSDIRSELKKRTFVVAASVLRNDPVWVPVSDIFNKESGEILQKAGIISFDDPRYAKYLERIQKVKAIESYPYVMQILEKDMSYEEVTEIFVRVNSLGIKLRGSDLALAQISSKWPGFIKLIDDFAKQFGDDGDYIIESGLPVRLLNIFATHQSKFKTIGKVSTSDLEDAWDKAIKGLQFAVNFIRNNAKIECLSQLSSPYLLVPIAVYAVLHNEKLDSEEEKKMLYWFYMAHMRGHYSIGSSESILDSDLSIIFRDGGVGQLIDQLKLHVKKFVVDSDDLTFKGIRSPFFSMLYFVLQQNGAKDWWSGISLSEKHLGRSHKIEFHHIFPKSLLRNAGYDQKEINEISNMAFIGGKTNRQILNKEPRIYLERDVLSKRGEEALTSQLIPIERSLWEIDNYHKFLEYRRKAVADKINAFVNQFK